MSVAVISTLPAVCRRLTSRIEGINVDAKIYWLFGANAVLQLVDNTLHTNGVNLACFNDLEAAVAVVLVIGRTAESGTDTGVNVCVVGKKSFLGSVPEVSAVVDASLLARRAAEDLGLPGVAVKTQMVSGLTRGDCILGDVY